MLARTPSSVPDAHLDRLPEGGQGAQAPGRGRTGGRGPRQAEPGMCPSPGAPGLRVPGSGSSSAPTAPRAGTREAGPDPAEPIPALAALLLSASHHHCACSLKPSKTHANKNEENDLLRLFILSASSGVLFFFSSPSPACNNLLRKVKRFLSVIFKELGPHMSLLSVMLLLGFDVVPNMNLDLPSSPGSLGSQRKKIPVCNSSHCTHA